MVATVQGMEEGVRDSACFLLVLTKGVLAREWVLKEFRWAIKYETPILMLYEKDDSMAGKWD